MREIKFRAWYEPDKQTKDGALKFKQVIFQDQLFFMHGLEDDEYCGRLIKYPFEVPFLDDDWTVEQFTGLTDKHGREIYEGDIIRFAKSNMSEKFDQGHVWYVDFLAHWAVSMNHLYSECSCQLNETYQREIVGSIHENPELLEK